MSTDYQPGTVAVATVRGVKGVRIFRYTSSSWVSAEPVSETRIHTSGHVTDIRPLVVLDPDTITTPVENAGLPAGHEIVMCLTRLAEADGAYSWRAKVARRLADQIEAQTKPPRIPEPGLWGVVYARCLDSGDTAWRFVRDAIALGGARWTAIENGDHYDWESLIDPTLIREGLS